MAHSHLCLVLGFDSDVSYFIFSRAEVYVFMVLSEMRNQTSTYEKIHVKLMNVLNVLGKLLKTILKIRNSRFHENFYSKNCRMLPVFDKLFGYFFGKEIILYIFLKT